LSTANLTKSEIDIDIIVVPAAICWICWVLPIKYFFFFLTDHRGSVRIEHDSHWIDRATATGVYDEKRKKCNS
jgi:hypothetical protein